MHTTMDISTCECAECSTYREMVARDGCICVFFDTCCEECCTTIECQQHSPKKG